MGAAIAKSGVPREELFFVSKIWVSNYRYEDAKASIDESLCKLGTDYLGLMLLRQAYHDVCGAWRALEEAYAEGKVRAIGVSNFESKQLMDICAFADVAPEIGKKYGKGVGQVALRFLMDEGVVVIPKSSKPARMTENFDVFDFELTEGDREQICTLDEGKSIILDHHNLDTVQFLLDRIKGQIDAAKK